MISCKQYGIDDKDAWDAFVATCRTPLFFFQRGYMDYHQDRFADGSLLFYEDEKLVALMPASLQGDKLVSHGGLTFGGLLLSPKIRAEGVLQCFESMTAFAKDVLGCATIIYKAIPHIFQTSAAEEDLYALTRSGATLVRRDLSSVIYLENRIPLSKGRKWLINRAKKHGLVVIESEDWSAFHALLSSALARHGVTPIHSVAELELLRSRFPDQIKLMAVESDGKMVAGLVLFRFGNVDHTQYLATCDEGKPLGALDYLIDTTLQASGNDNVKFFSFGASTEQQGHYLNAGLIEQKENFGARGLTLDFYEIKLS